MIHLSHAAIGEINRIKTYRATLETHFRIGVKPGGCSGLYYTIELDETVVPDDQIWNCDGIQIVVSSNSLVYISGLTLDYSEDLMGGGFRFYNPNAVQVCGCGNSFTVNQS